MYELEAQPQQNDGSYVGSSLGYLHVQGHWLEHIRFPIASRSRVEVCRLGPGGEVWTTD